MIGLNLSNLFKSTTNALLKHTTNSMSTSSLSKSMFNFSSLKSALPTIGQKNITLLGSQTQHSLPQLTVQARNVWGYRGKMMLRDIKRRELIRKFGPIRVRLQTVKTNNILPKALKKAAEEEDSKITRHSYITYITDRCVQTSKPGGLLHRWRLSRHVWRDLVDYNQMSGVMRATWGVPTRNSVAFSFKRPKKTWLKYDGIREVSVLGKNGEVKRMKFKIG